MLTYYPASLKKHKPRGSGFIREDDVQIDISINWPTAFANEFAPTMNAIGRDSILARPSVDPRYIVNFQDRTEPVGAELARDKR